jgi:hypothetical protein
LASAWSKLDKFGAEAAPQLGCNDATRESENELPFEPCYYAPTHCILEHRANLQVHTDVASMPKLLIFAPCERVIIDDQKIASLITLMQSVTTSAPANIQISQDTVAAQNWSIFTLWMPQTEDINKDFVQVTQVLWPDGNEFNKHTQPIRFEKGKTHQVALKVMGFPIGQIGTISLNVWLEHNLNRVGEIHSFPIEVIHS